jgi:hypothetical protein
VKGTCFLKMDNGVSEHVDAEIFGEWAVHVQPGRWVHGRGKPRPAIGITHVPSGLKASCLETNCITKTQALRVAKHLAKAIPVGQAADEAFGREVWKQILVATYGEDTAEQIAKERQ